MTENPEQERPDFIQQRTQHTKTALVWDGGAVQIPAVMGVAPPGRMEGTDGERLCELGGRVCYDSLTVKKSRTSPEYHKHILEVGHYSVFRHFTWTIKLNISRLDGEAHMHAILACTNRPGVLVCDDPQDPGAIRITLNVQSALEWDKWTRIRPQIASDPQIASLVREAVVQTSRTLLPTITRLAGPTSDHKPGATMLEPGQATVAAPLFDHEKTISLYMCGGRGFSHELVRHAYGCGISQRSTRYCQESDSPWLLHPAIRTFLQENENSADAIDLELAIQNAEGAGRFAYEKIMKTLKPWLTDRLPSDDEYRASTALKQSRGAARGYLGNALETELIFTAHVPQWRAMMRLRASDAADGEICDIFADSLTNKQNLETRELVLGALRASRYGASFADLELAPRSDRTALCLRGGGAK